MREGLLDHHDELAPGEVLAGEKRCLKTEKDQQCELSSGGYNMSLCHSCPPSSLSRPRLLVTHRASSPPGQNGSANTGPRPAKSGHEGSKRHPERPKTAPRSDPNLPKSGQDRAKRDPKRPRAAQTRPRLAKSRRRPVQDRPRAAQDQPKSPEQRPRRDPRVARNSSNLCFSLGFVTVFAIPAFFFFEPL
jgi:hypothetical protein